MSKSQLRVKKMGLYDPTTRRQRERSRQNNNFAHAFHFFSLPFLYDYDVKLPNFTF